LLTRVEIGHAASPIRICYYYAFALSRSRARVASPRDLSRATKTIRAPILPVLRGGLANSGRAARDDNSLPPHKRSRLC
jgi:hypothetical protein